MLPYEGIEDSTAIQQLDGSQGVTTHGSSVVKRGKEVVDAHAIIAVVLEPGWLLPRRYLALGMLK